MNRSERFHPWQLKHGLGCTLFIIADDFISRPPLIKLRIFSKSGMRISTLRDFRRLYPKGMNPREPRPRCGAGGPNNRDRRRATKFREYILSRYTYLG